MRGLNDNELLRLWEEGRTLPNQRRALAMLMAGCPEGTLEELAMLSVGERDRQLVRLRELTFGQHVSGLANCRHCHEQMELNLDTRVLIGTVPSGELNTCSVTVRQYGMTVRLPTTADLLALEPGQAPEQARRQLIRRCLVKVEESVVEVTQDALPDDIIDSLPDLLDGCDPMANLELEVFCPSCQAKNHVLFDVVQFFWGEIASAAKRILGSIHELARAYGWSEAAILTLSGSRRQMYLEMLGT
jgi:hypothetical protein